MECSFRPYDRDLTTEDMGVVWKGYWAVLEGCWAATHTRPFRFAGQPLESQTDSKWHEI